MIAVFATLDQILGFYTYIIIGNVIFSWLYAFNVVNSNNRLVYMIGGFFYQMTEPALRPIRRILPNLGNLDLSPIVLLFAVYFVRKFLSTSVQPYFI